ncbi:MAG: GIY-YIG nuclease family protein [Chloroflexi bacterium]|nr:GIY-YIG nuclease family protein [Chloroflexota bacterium]
MEQETPYYIYILTDEANGRLYTGMTNNLARRLKEHRAGRGGRTTREHATYKLVYYETCPDRRTAMLREREVKKKGTQYRRKLVNAANPEWRDLSETA